MKRIDQLTFTRFVAAMAVVFSHNAKGVFPFTIPSFGLLFTSGYIAVTYFFVLSGFVLSLAYSPWNKKLNPGEYFFSRFARIYPIYLLSFLITCLYYLDDMAKIGWAKIFANLFLVQAWIPSYALSFNFVAWSLSVEVFLYLVFPLVIYFFARLSTRNFLITAVFFWIVAQCLLSFILPRVSNEVFRYLIYFPPVYLSSFVLGVAAGLWYQKMDKNSVHSILNLGLLALGIILLALGLLFQLSFYRLPVLNTLSFGLMAPVYLLIILPLALDQTFLSKALSHPWLRTLGDASYALFILNIPLRWFAESAITALRLQISPLIFTYGFLLLAVLISIFSYYKFEHPVRLWLNANKSTGWLLLMDAAALSLAILLAFLFRISAQDLFGGSARVFAFVLRVSIPILMILFLAFRLYSPLQIHAMIWRSIFATLLGMSAVSTLSYWAFQNNLVEIFPRAILLLMTLFIFAAGILTRFTFKKYYLISPTSLQ